MKDVNSRSIHRKRRGNPNWGKPRKEFTGRTQFEIEAAQIPQERWVSSPKLREWAGTHKNTNYIPEFLLDAWELKVEDCWG